MDRSRACPPCFWRACPPSLCRACLLTTSWRIFTRGTIQGLSVTPIHKSLYNQRPFFLMIPISKEMPFTEKGTFVPCQGLTASSRSLARTMSPEQSSCHNQSVVPPLNGEDWSHSLMGPQFATFSSVCLLIHTAKTGSTSRQYPDSSFRSIRSSSSAFLAEC